MHSKTIQAMAIAIFLSATAAEARSQGAYGYYPGYGGYGWGGWGGTGTVPGNIARGLGYFNRGAGIYNRQTAIANSINANTVMRWNEYWYQSQKEAERRYARRLAEDAEEARRLGEAKHERLVKNPTEVDIESGDALNVVLDQVTDPRIHSSALRMATDPISGKAVREIPFFNAPQAATINLDRLTVENGWPAALRGPDFAPERQAYRKAVDSALAEAVDRESQISAANLREMGESLARMRAKLKAAPPKDPIEAANARDYLKALTGMTRMLDRPRIEKIMAELETIDKTTIGSLLGFMQTYNLRFGRAKTPRQRAVYQELYPRLVALRDKFREEIGKPDDPVAAGDRASGGPTDFFGGMDLDDLGGQANE